MPNSNSPFGLKPVRHLLGLPMNGAVQPMFIPAGYATALFIGDPVVKTTGGSNTALVKAPGLGEFAIGTLPEINKATAAGTTNRLTGVIVAFAANPDNLQLVHRPASTERLAFVCVDPFVVFEIQADGAVAAADMGNNAQLIFTQAGSTFTGLSGVELDSTTLAATATHQLKVLKAVNRVDNDTTITRAKVEVLINLHTEMNISTGLGI
jgi:hypothetical protein